MNTLPRPSNKPRAELEQLAAAAIRDNGGPELARVFYKYDCAGCSRRINIAEPDVLPRRARCMACGTWTEFVAGGFMLQTRRSVDTDWATPDGLYFRKVYQNFPQAAASVEFER